MPKNLVFLIIVLIALIITGCASTSGGLQPTSLSTQTSPTLVIQPSATPLPPTEMPTSLPPTPSATPPPENVIPHFPVGQEFTVTTIHMMDASNGWAIGGLLGAGDHVFYTTDGGNTWKDVTPPEPESASNERKFVTGFFQDAHSAWVTYAIDTGNPVPPQAVVWRTADGGTTWQASQPLDVSDLSEIYVPSDLQFVSGQSGWLLVHVGVGMNHDYFVMYRSMDSGASWARIIDPYNDATGIQSCSKNSILFTDATHGWLTGDCNGVKAGVLLYKTSDAGSTWQEVTLPEPVDYPGLFSNESQVACGSYNPFFFGNELGHLNVKCHDFSGTQITNSYYLYTTQDGGGTWKSVTYPGQALYFFSANIGWALASKIQQTTDGGTTWKAISDVSWTPQMDFVSEQLGWAVATTGQEIALVKTENGGAKWSMLVPTVGQ